MLHYDYTRHHMNGIVQFYLKNYEQGMESCHKAIAFCRHIKNTNKTRYEPSLKKIFAEQKLNVDVRNLKFYVDVQKMQQATTE
jgi:hypothetical protein